MHPLVVKLEEGATMLNESDIERGKGTERKEDNKGGEIKTSYIVTVQDNGSPVFYQVRWVHHYSHHFQHSPFFHVGEEDAKM